ncbi:hypothetical protein ABN584_27455 [Gloeocapsa sp. BRSZ]
MSEDFNLDVLTYLTASLTAELKQAIAHLNLIIWDVEAARDKGYINNAEEYLKGGTADQIIDEYRKFLVSTMSKTIFS